MTANNFDDLINQYSQLYNVPAALIKSIMATESAFNPYAKNPNSSASGLMQLVKGTAEWMSQKFNIAFDWTTQRYDPAKNVQLGTAYLADQLNRFGGDIPKTIAAYYSGTPNGSVDERNYVDKVLSYFNQFSDDPSPTTPNGPPAGTAGGSTVDNSVFWIGLAGITGYILLKRFL